ncbi:hypothetical protein [Streptosporangium subroseum]|nr:hypothetical protein [Streptosporangium subroseum]
MAAAAVLLAVHEPVIAWTIGFPLNVVGFALTAQNAAARLVDRMRGGAE